MIGNLCMIVGTLRHTCAKWNVRGLSKEKPSLGRLKSHVIVRTYSNSDNHMYKLRAGQSQLELVFVCWTWFRHWLILPSTTTHLSRSRCSRQSWRRFLADTTLAFSRDLQQLVSLVHEDRDLIASLTSRLAILEALVSYTPLGDIQ